MGIVEIHQELTTVCIFAQIYFYGNEASEALSIQIGEDINAYWNIPNGKVFIGGKQYRFMLNVVGNYAPTLTPRDIESNTDPKRNFFRVEKVSNLNISFVDGLNSNTGYFQLDNILNNSTTAAHEFGHTLGLDHPEDLDIRGTGTPGIMYPRGTLVDPHYQYDGSAIAGQVGGTINPVHRRVLQTDIDNLHIEKLKFNREGIAVIGDFSSIWHNAHA
jgi:hypothetical protein